MMVASAMNTHRGATVRYVHSRVSGGAHYTHWIHHAELHWIKTMPNVGSPEQSKFEKDCWTTLVHWMLTMRCLYAPLMPSLCVPLHLDVLLLWHSVCPYCSKYVCFPRSVTYLGSFLTTAAEMLFRGALTTWKPLLWWLKHQLTPPFHRMWKWCVIKYTRFTRSCPSLLTGSVLEVYQLRKRSC